MVLFEAVQMNREEQVGRRLEQVQLLLQQQRIGAERDEFLPGHDAFNDLADLLVDERLAARDRDPGGAALVDRVEALLDGEPAIQDRVGIVDLAAAEAGEIAAKQRLQHQHQRVTFAAQELLLEDVGAESDLPVKRNSHRSNFLFAASTLRQIYGNMPPSTRPSRAVGRQSTLECDYLAAGTGQPRMGGLSY